MTEDERHRVQQFEARVRQLLLQYQTLQKVNKELNETVSQKEEEIAQLQQELSQSQSDYQTLKLAKMIEISDGDIKETRQRISRLVREVNKCIGLLSNETEEIETK